MKSGCGYVHIPEVDNSNSCTDFISTECLIVNRRSSVLKNSLNSDMNEYLELLDKKLMQLTAMVTQLKKENKVLVEIINQIESGGNLDGIGTWELGD